MIKLKDLLKYSKVVIQCHDVPDADALASGYAVYRFFEAAGKPVRFVYSGREKISKPNLINMISLLEIPVEYAEEIPEPDLLVMVDCQYGESNVRKFPAKEICIIDHHEVMDRNRLPEMNEVMESYGSCATVLYGLLKEAGYGIAGDLRLQTALYYGLYTDTGKFQELWHPSDKDMWDELKPDEGILDILKNANIAAGDLSVIGGAFARHEINEEYRYGIVEVKTGDPNILGIVSDTLLEVDTVDVCVAYAFLKNGVKISVRTCRKETRADELAKWIALGIGNAGGHIRKAGGFILKERLSERDSGDWKTTWKELLHGRLQEYFDNTDVIRAGDDIDLTGYSLYRKLPVKIGVANLNRIFSKGDKVRIRTLEGDIELTVSTEHYLLIGVSEEIYPIRRETFRKNYRSSRRSYEFSGEYIPGVRNHRNGRLVSLAGITKECKALGTSLVYAKQLTRRTHVFTIWDPQKYIYGEPGDWIAVQKDNPEDVYIIGKRIFEGTYTLEK